MNENKVNVPLSILIDNLKKSIRYSINSSHLPLCISESILKDILSEVSEGAKKQIETDRLNFEQSLKESKNDNCDKQSEKESEEDELHENKLGE